MLFRSGSFARNLIYSTKPHQVKGAAKKYAAQASEAVSDVTEAVRNNPLTGLVAAGAIGIVLGLLLGRK